MKLKKKIVDNLNSSKFGSQMVAELKHRFGRLPAIDEEFPKLIGIELSSLCNLSCKHCPPQMNKSNMKHQMLDYDLFLKIIDEIDSFGKRRIALHKDGEPLLYPKIESVMARLKTKQMHHIYLSTNAHLLNENISLAILENSIDVVNFSIGAASAEFYSKVRGHNFDKVVKNIQNFLNLSEKYTNKPLIQVQIINLPEYSEINEEIESFKLFWKEFGVKIDVWDKLTWGVFDDDKSPKHRYPCLSLWESLDVNSDGTVSVCCMDWEHKLLVGNISEKSIYEIWHSPELRTIRDIHIGGRENELDACKKCNYWSWQARLKEYF